MATNVLGTIAGYNRGKREWTLTIAGAQLHFHLSESGDMLGSGDQVLVRKADLLVERNGHQIRFGQRFLVGDKILRVVEEVRPSSSARTQQSVTKTELMPASLPPARLCEPPEERHGASLKSGFHRRW